MTAIGATGDRTEAIGVLDKRHIIAREGFNRWLVPPAALAIHLCIGMAYGFSVFWLPLSRAVGITAPTAADWRVSTLGWMYTLFFVLLGSSAALFGRWVEEQGPRKTKVSVTWSPHEATDAERKTFDEGRESMKQGWGGTMDQFADYLGSVAEK